MTPINTPRGVKEQFQYVLPPTAMGAVKAILANEDQPKNERLTAAIIFVFGWGWWQQQESVDPTAFAIPEDQWQTICGWFNDMGSDPIDQVNWGLSWMNSGPAGYKP